jgi:hypothetical protein
LISHDAGSFPCSGYQPYNRNGLVDKARLPIQTFSMRDTRILVHIFVVMVLMVPSAFADEGQGLAGNDVKNAMRPYMQAVRDCAVRQHELDPTIEGKLELSFTISNRGRVIKVQVLDEKYARTYVAGCAGGVLRSMVFPKFKGRPVVVPKFPVALGPGPEKIPGPLDEDEEKKPNAAREAPRKLRAKVLRKVKKAFGTIKACVKDHPAKKQEGKKRKRKRRKKAPRIGPLKITFTLNPLGRTIGVDVLDKIHGKNHVAGCVAGVLSFVEFPAQGSDNLSFSKVALPRF